MEEINKKRMRKMEFTVEDGKELIEFTRKSIIYHLKNQKELPIPPDLQEKYSKNLGAFVTLNKIYQDEKILRGCIGITQPYFPLIETISKVSISAAFNDPRFPPIILDDMDEICVEVSILTQPELIKVNDPEEYLHKIKIGRDGLYIKKGFKKGLLLPQVPVERGRNWNAETFLQHLCMKAFLPKNAWKDKNVEIYSFQAVVFEEIKPNGEIQQKKEVE